MPHIQLVTPKHVILPPNIQPEQEAIDSWTLFVYPDSALSTISILSAQNIAPLNSFYPQAIPNHDLNIDFGMVFVWKKVGDEAWATVPVTEEDIDIDGDPFASRRSVLHVI